ncbi:MAG: hypothetical protein ABJF88_18305 [Rhodothermales bacterium]
MFIGHLAVALGAKSIDRQVPLPLLIGASFGIDLLWPIFILIGIETVEIDPGNTAFTPLYFVSYPWSHSLLTVLGWSLLLGLIARGMGLSSKSAILVGGLVTSHWVLDWLTHRPDLPLWPGGKVTGLGLWNSIPATMIVEGSMLVLGAILFFRTVKPNGWKGWIAISSLLLLVVAIWASQPFSPPPPSSEAIAIVGLTTFLLPLWGLWIEKQSTELSHAA